MSDESAVKQIAYVYDGTFEGVLCCVFFSYTLREIPAEIRTDELTLLPVRRVPYNEAHAERVAKGIRNNICRKAYSQAQLMFMTDEPGKELAILRYLRRGFDEGARLMGMLSDEWVHRVDKAVKALLSERHRIIQFLRFSDFDGYLAAEIEPKGFVLPLLKQHFIDRFPEERLFVFDRAHGAALVYEDRKSAIVPVGDYEMPEPGEQEKRYRALFKLFYDTIEIKPRHNERCRMSHMPKRFWKNMTEFQ